MLFSEEPEVKNSKLIKIYLSLETSDFRDKKYLMIDNKIIYAVLL